MSIFSAFEARLVFLIPTKVEFIPQQTERTIQELLATQPTSLDEEHFEIIASPRPFCRRTLSSILIPATEICSSGCISRNPLHMREAIRSSASVSMPSFFTMLGQHGMADRCRVPLCSSLCSMGPHPGTQIAPFDDMGDTRSTRTTSWLALSSLPEAWTMPTVWRLLDKLRVHSSQSESNGPLLCMAFRIQIWQTLPKRGAENETSSEKNGCHEQTSSKGVSKEQKDSSFARFRSD